MSVYYISPATIPSRSAHSIHVANMCEAFTELDHDVTLFVRSEKHDSSACKSALSEYYGIDSERIDVVVYKSQFGRGAEPAIAMMALLCYIKDFLQGRAPEFIVSRNLYGAVLLGIFLGRQLIYETHAPDKGVRKHFQAWLLKTTRTSVLVISNALRRVIASLHGVPEKTMTVMHDAARSGQEPMSVDERGEERTRLLGDSMDLHAFDIVAGYFGHLFPGRGIEVIQGMATINPKVAFVVYGGNKKEIEQYRKNNTVDNLFFMGHLLPSKVRKAMAMMDVLLMPYQKSVSVGMKGVDTASWMSPMKLFEYMSVGVPIISSDLPVLREILSDSENCLLVTCDDVQAWSDALQRLHSCPEHAEKISHSAYQQYLEQYTWQSRAKRMLALMGN